MVLKLELCALHKTGIFSVTDQTSPDPQTQGDRPRPALSPTPPNASPPVNPNADRVLSRGTDGAASHPVQRTPRRSRSPVRRPAPNRHPTGPHFLVRFWVALATLLESKIASRTLQDAFFSDRFLDAFLDIFLIDF